jgi:hypothetical protein
VTPAGGAGRRRWRPGVVAWALWGVAILGVATLPWFDRLLRQAHRPELTQLDASTVPSVLAALVATTIGAVLASRRPRHPVGWLLLGLGLAVTASGVADGYARYGLLARPGALPAARWVAVYSPATLGLGFVCVGFILLLTPSGSLPSPRWRWWAWLMAAGPALFLVTLAVGPGLVIAPYDAVIDPVGDPALTGAVRAAIAVAIAMAAGGLVAGAWSLVLRFRRATGVERQQLRWVAFAAALTVPPAAVVLAGAATGTTAAALVVLAAGVCMALLPLATGAAILRYRLYDLDRIISRTVTYGLLTALLGLGYAVVVLGLGRLLPRTPAWSWPPPPSRWPRCSSRPAAASSGWSTGGSTAATTTPPRRSPRSAPACATSSTSTPSRPSCSPWPSRRCSRPRCRCGCDHNPGASRIPPLDADQPVTAPPWFSPARSFRLTIATGARPFRAGRDASPSPACDQPKPS